MGEMPPGFLGSHLLLPSQSSTASMASRRDGLLQFTSEHSVSVLHDLFFKQSQEKGKGVWSSTFRIQ
jgi:hypothetical protein